jgi:hypothetical protein
MENSMELPQKTKNVLKGRDQEDCSSRTPWGKSEALYQPRIWVWWHASMFSYVKGIGRRVII